jgi:hypothetical protein
MTVTFAQPKSQRRIYLWDVTLSMFGQKCVNGDIVNDPNGKNIYNEVRRILIRDIETITDESTEVIVLPFQENILVNADDWCVKANDAGKEEIIRKIKNYPKQGCSWTNIVRPIKKVQADIISPDKNNILVLLTDGVQSEIFGGKEELIKFIHQWGQYAESNFAYCLYVMLTKEAIDEEVKKKIEETPNIDVVTEPGEKEWIDLQPSELVKFNIKDDKVAKIPLKYRQSVKLPDNINVQVVAEDSIISINQEITVKDGAIAFEVNYKEPYNVLKTKLAETTRIPLNIKLLNKEEVEKTANKIVYITKEVIELELINKPEKTLKISIKK